MHVIKKDSKFETCLYLDRDGLLQCCEYYDNLLVKNRTKYDFTRCNSGDMVDASTLSDKNIVNLLPKIRAYLFI